MDNAQNASKQNKIYRHTKFQCFKHWWLAAGETIEEFEEELNASNQNQVIQQIKCAEPVSIRYKGTKSAKKKGHITG
jgi:hypothetical protein